MSFDRFFSGSDTPGHLVLCYNGIKQIGGIRTLNYQVKTLFFSATGNTKKVVGTIADKLSAAAGGKPARTVDFTLPDGRKEPAVFSKEDLVVVGIPVYAGRIPNLLLPYLNSVRGNGALAVAVVTYGNRNYDDALSELRGLLEEHGFSVIAGGAFIGEHSFSTTLGKGRPDAEDLAAAGHFGKEIAGKIARGDLQEPFTVPGNYPPLPYYQPRDKDGNAVSILKVIPKTLDSCTKCGLCARICPMGSIDADDPSGITGKCTKCCACVKYCPVEAKYFDDPGYLWHKQELEEKYTVPARMPEYYL